MINLSQFYKGGYSIVMKIIDLSIRIQTDMPHYPGDPIPNVFQALSLEHDQCRVSALNIGSHTGTHIDVPSHIITDGQDVCDFSLDNFIGKGLVIPLDYLRPNQAIVPSDVDMYIDEINEADVILFNTGWTDTYGSKNYYKHPTISPELATLLAKCHIKAIGVDMLSIDPTIKSFKSIVPINRSAHEILLRNNIIIIENLTNLEKICFDNPTIMFLPLPITGCDGSPVRAVAMKI